MPLAYSSSSIARSRSASGLSPLGALRSASTSSTVRVSGRDRPSFGELTLSVGSVSTTPSSTRNANSDLADATLRARVVSE